MTDLRGEFVWDGHFLHGADIAIGDFGHESHFEQQIMHALSESLIEFCEELEEYLQKVTDNELNADQIKFLHKANSIIQELQSSHEGINPDDFYELENLLKNASLEIYQRYTNKNKELISGLKDPRLWGVKAGYIISRNSHFEVWKWNKDVEKSLLDMIYDINPQVDPKTEIDVFSYFTKKHYSFTIEQLEASESGQQVSAATTKSNIHIPWNRQELVGDNFNPQFKKWLKLQEGKN